MVANGTVFTVSTSLVSIFLGNGDGTFQSRVDYGPGEGAHPGGVVVADFNGDSKADLAALAGPTGGVAILLGNGDGTFQPATFSRVLLPGAITLGDFNGDGKIDVFSTANVPGSGSFGVFFAGNGDGTFQAGAITVGLMHPRGMFPADFDGDGRLDLVTPQGQGSVLVWTGNGNGTFWTSPLTLAAGSSPSYIATADLNRDKSPDIVVTNTGDNTISVLLNTVGTDFSISASKTSPSTVSPGQSATSTVSLSLLNAFDNPASLTCSVQPAQAGSPTCSINPNSVTFDASGKATAQLTITAGAALASLTRPSANHGSLRWQFAWLPVVGFALMGGSLGRSYSKKRRMMGLFAACCLFTGLIAQSACGGSSNDSKTQTYTVTVTATSAATQHSTTVSLTVH